MVIPGNPDDGQEFESLVLQFSHEESFLMTTQLGNDVPVLSLSGEFVDPAARTLRHFVPAIGGFAIDDLPVCKTEFTTADRLRQARSTV